MILSGRTKPKIYKEDSYKFGNDTCQVDERMGKQIYEEMGQNKKKILIVLREREREREVR